MNSFRCIIFSALVLAGSGAALATQPLTLVEPKAGRSYLRQGSRPLLAVDALPHTLLLGERDFDSWLEWALENRLSYLYATAPLDWRAIEMATEAQGNQVQFPYQETSPGSREFDLRRFNQDYWSGFRDRVARLREAGITVHLVMWTAPEHLAAAERQSHFFHPDNNSHAATDPLRTATSVVVTEPILELQRPWFTQLTRAVADFDNLLLDVAHLSPIRKPPEEDGWFQQMVRTTRHAGESVTDRRLILAGQIPEVGSSQLRKWFEETDIDVAVLDSGSDPTALLQVGRPWGVVARSSVETTPVWDNLLHGAQFFALSPSSPPESVPKRPAKRELAARILTVIADRLQTYSRLLLGRGTLSAGERGSGFVASTTEALAVLRQSDDKAGEQRVKLAAGLQQGTGYRIDLLDPDSKTGVVATTLGKVDADGQLEFVVPAFTSRLIVHVTSTRLEPHLARPIRFQKRILADAYYCDGIAVGDLNSDQHPDIVAGPFWYAGPDFEVRQAFYEPVALPPAESPSNSMFSFVHDFNGDGRPDILVLGRVHKHEAAWYENPGSGGGLWKRHFVFERVRGESPCLVDLDGNGRPQLICHWEGCWGYLESVAGKPYSPWEFTPIGEDEEWPQFYHGEGVGDLNGDGRMDILLNDGWYEQPAHPQPLWVFHRTRFSSERGGAQMFALDVDADGDQDVISALHAHEWGLAWFEQMKVGTDRRFRERLIMGDRSQEANLGAAFSQPHALALGDIDGDGKQDLVTGKRMWAHGPAGDVEPNADPVLYWFRQVHGDRGEVRFEPHPIDDRSGVGVQLEVADVNRDGRMDILTVSKLGTFLFLNQGGGE